MPGGGLPARREGLVGSAAAPGRNVSQRGPSAEHRVGGLERGEVPVDPLDPFF